MKEGGKMLPMYDDKVISKINLPYKLAQLTSIQVLVNIVFCCAIICVRNYENVKFLRITLTSVFKISRVSCLKAFARNKFFFSFFYRIENNRL